MLFKLYYIKEYKNSYFLEKVGVVCEKSVEMTLAHMEVARSIRSVAGLKSR